MTEKREALSKALGSKGLPQHSDALLDAGHAPLWAEARADARHVDQPCQRPVLCNLDGVARRLRPRGAEILTEEPRPGRPTRTQCERSLHGAPVRERGSTMVRTSKMRYDDLVVFLNHGLLRPAQDGE